MSADARMDAELNGRAHGLEPDGKESEAEHQQALTQADRAKAASLDSATPEQFALFGARHDFSVRDSSGAVSCRCVGALLGPPSSGKLAWQGEMPHTKPETQLVIALVPLAGDCGDNVASYWGYRIENNDVVVFVESWKAGRPQTLGAIIPKPPAGGQVFLASVNAKLPFGAPGGRGRCPLGNPGPQRTETWNGAENASSSEENTGTDTE